MKKESRYNKELACYGYSLYLSNGQRWQLLSAHEIKSWLAEMASVMKLKICSRLNIYPKVIFTGNKRYKKDADSLIDGLNPVIQKALPKKGWECSEFRFYRLWSHPSIADIILDIGDWADCKFYYIKMWHSLYLIYNQIVDVKGFPIHAALVEHNKKGFLLAGSAMAGKTTCCSRLPSGWNSLCDDTTVVVANGKKGYYAHPFPTWGNYVWRNSKGSWDTRYHTSLKAVFFLRPDKIDKIIPIGQGQAANLIYRFSREALQLRWMRLNIPDRSRHREYNRKLFENVSRLAMATPAFILRFSLSGCFWNLIKKVLNDA